MIPEDMKRLYEYIKDEIIPKYDCVEDCTMIELSELIWEDVEFLFKVNEDLDFDDFGLIKFLIGRELVNGFQKVVDETSSSNYIYVVSKY
ncbi:MAG: hypothetical protein K8V75_01735 [Methanobrevibacter woesei]|nr:hypothetical protein [Methanobrevibacter woesei]